MELTWWWLGLIILAATLLVVVLSWLLAGREGAERPLLAAHTRRLTDLAVYRNALARSRWRLAALVTVLGLTLVPTAWAASRPADGDVVDPEKRNRDIMLCLDVSGSMAVTDQEILTSFAGIVGGFQGERIGLVLFDSQAVTAFPLTDDYDLVKTQLEEYAKGFATFGGGDGLDPRAGTWSPSATGTSLIPDGLASCLLGFDRRSDTERPRAVILGTDNMEAGTGVYTSDEAFEQAKKLGVRVYAIDPNNAGSDHDRLVAATEDTGGTTYGLGWDETVSSITSEIDKIEAARLADTKPQLLRTDTPRWPVLLLVLGLLAYVPLAWRWRR